MDLKLDDALQLAKKTLKEGSAEGAKRIYQDILRRFPANEKAKIGLKAESDRVYRRRFSSYSAAILTGIILS